MKKTALYGILLLILAAALTVGLSLTAFADDEPTAQWDSENFGNAKWDAVTDATGYTVKLYYKDFLGSDAVLVTTKTLASDILEYDFIPETKTGGDITVDKLGNYYFTVDAATAGDAVSLTSPEKPFLKLQKPTDGSWSTTSNNILARWTPNSENSVDAGYPDPTTVAYQLTLLRVTGGSSVTEVGKYSIAQNVTSKNMNTVLQSIPEGSFTFRVYATCEFAFDSDSFELPVLNALTYPIQINKPVNLSWGSGNDAGIAQWSTAADASSYTVTFYQAKPVTETVKLVEGKIVADSTTGPDVTTHTMIVGYDYAQVGSPQTVNAASTTVANLQCDLDNVSVKESGVYFFSVVGHGQNNATPSAAAGFDISSLPANKQLFRITYTKDGNTEFYDEATQHAALLSKIRNDYSAAIPSNVVFDFVKTGDIRLDLNNDGTDDTIQTGLTVFLPLGDSVTIGAARYTDTSSTVIGEGGATDVPLIWNPTQNASLITLSRSGDKLTMTGLNEGVVTLKVTAKYSPYAGKEIKVFVSRKPTKLTISGRNSFIVAEGSYQLQLAIEPATASSDKQYFEWTSNDNTVVTVNEGLITPRNTALSSSPSYAEITVKSLLSGVTDTFRIAVSNEGIMPARIDITGNSAVPLKSTLQLSAEVYSDLVISSNSGFVTNKDVTWTSSNEKVATVDQNGKVTPKALGKCTITATSKASNSGHVKGTKEIEVVPEEINITKLALSGNKTLTVGESTDITLAITPTNATDRSVVWSCTGGGTIVKKSELVYTLTAKAAGTATVSVYATNAPSIRAEIIVTTKTASDAPETGIGETEIITNIKPTAGTGDKAGEYTAEIKAEVLDEAITKVFKEAIPIKTTPIIRMKVATPANAVSAIVKIPYNSVYKIINYSGYRDKGVLVVETGIGTMTFPPEALRSLYGQAYSNSGIQVKMVNVVNTDLTEVQQKAADGRKVYEYLVSSGGKSITSFGNYPITISIPYSLTSTQSGKGAQVYYLNTIGGLVSMSTTYDYKAKVVEFDTIHLSLYIPYYYAAVAWDNPFDDVRLTDWYYDSVFYVCDRGLMRGISAERFVPGSYTTRAMVVTILHRLAGSPAAKEANTFVDVQEDQWYTEAVLWATEEGLVSGYGGRKFGPNDQVTREQLGVMLHNYAKFVDITPKYGWDTPMKYPDSYQVSSWARQGAMYCQITGIITGRYGGYFDPKGVANRSELATMLLRMNNQMEEQLASTKSK